jgi:colicin import membrane protein
LIQDNYNIIPVTFAAIFHGLVIAGLIYAVDFSRPMHPSVPLAIKATLVLDEDIPQTAPPPVEEPEVVPEPEPEPEPEPQPDRDEEERVRAEEEKRQADLRAEQQRIREQDEAERKRRQKEAAERKKQQEAELERRREEAERKRLEDLERQRKENERLKKEAESAERQRQLDVELAAETQRQEAMNAGELSVYQFAIMQQLQRNWIEPATAVAGIECVVNVRQLPSGDVVGVTIGSCNGDDSVRRSIEAAVYKASPLPLPSNPSLFQRNLTITFRPEQ